MTHGEYPDDFEFIADMQAAKGRAEDFQRLQDMIAGRENGYGGRHERGAGDQSRAALRKGGRKESGALEILDAQMAALQSLIDEREQVFAGQYGEDWREQIALELLDPHVMPQRRDGESMDDYRKRVEQALIEELLDENGNIKDRYKNHPTYGDLGEWAQWKHDENAVQALKARLDDPALSPSERVAIFEAFAESASYQRIMQATVAVNPDSSEQATLDTTAEHSEDNFADASPAVGDNGFLG